MYKQILDILYPRCCPLCHEVLRDSRALVCPECISKIRPLGGARCMRCGKPVERETEYCADCMSHPRRFTEGRGIFLYDRMWKVSLVKYKYYGCREYGDFYAAALCRYGAGQLRRWRPDVIVPVPLHRRKQRQRGFNQAAYLAERMGEILEIPAAAGLVKKIRSTDSQKKLNAPQRRKNLESAFEGTQRVDGLRVLVVDDVYTTGSTMDAMAACLEGMGAERVYFLTVCMGR